MVETYAEAASKLLTAAEVSEHLRVPIATLYVWRHRSEGPPAIKVGRHLRYRVRDLEAWLEQRGGAP
jgi:excisionase family DNA binding protein